MSVTVRSLLRNSAISSRFAPFSGKYSCPKIITTSNDVDDGFLHPLPGFPGRILVRTFDIYQFGNKEAVKKERARLADEMTRGYFADISELKKHGGKIAKANKTIVPAMTARKFPALEVLFADGSPMKLPLVVDGTEMRIDAISPKATLLCLSFRANSQAMVESWTAPFVKSFGDSKDIHIYEISFIDSWFLSINPIKHLLLRTLRQSKHDGSRNLHRHAVYSFGDHYYLRKELHILNLLTGYIFLLDEFGRIRWQGFGFAQEEETSSLTSCTNQLLEEQ